MSKQGTNILQGMGSTNIATHTNLGATIAAAPINISDIECGSLELPDDIISMQNVIFSIMEELIEKKIINGFVVLNKIKEYERIVRSDHKTEHFIEFLIESLPPADKIIYKLEKEIANE